MNRGISTIRPAETADLPLLSEFWYDRMTLLMQTNPSIRLLPDARTKWESAAAGWMQDERTVFLTGLAGQEIVGAIAGRIEPNLPGLAPETVARMMELVIDMHTPHMQQGIGRVLLTAFRDRMRADGIQQMAVQVTGGVAVEAAFWRGMGSKSYAELVWMDV
jgi:hypothetical protein